MKNKLILYISRDYFNKSFTAYAVRLTINKLI